MTKQHLEAIDLDDLDHVSGGGGRDFSIPAGLQNINLGQIVNGINTITKPGGFNFGSLGTLAQSFGLPTEFSNFLGQAGNFAQSIFGGGTTAATTTAATTTEASNPFGALGSIFSMFGGNQAAATPAASTDDASAALQAAAVQSGQGLDTV